MDQFATYNLFQPLLSSIVTTSSDVISNHFANSFLLLYYLTYSAIEINLYYDYAEDLGLKYAHHGLFLRQWAFRPRYAYFLKLLYGQLGTQTP